MGRDRIMKGINLLMNILSAMLAFSFASFPMGIGTVGSFLAFGRAFDDEKLSGLSSVLIFLLTYSLDFVFQESTLQVSTSFAVLIAVPAVIALILTIINATAKPDTGTK